MSDATVGRVEFGIPQRETLMERFFLGCRVCEAKVQRIAELEADNAELRKDKARLDWMADTRVFDGIGDKDIDEMTLDAVKGNSEEEWVAEWRVQMRAAIDAAMERTA